MELDIEMADLKLCENSETLEIVKFEKNEQDRQTYSEKEPEISSEQLSDQEETLVPRRSLRKKKYCYTNSEKRRVIRKPKKILDDSNLKELKKFYMCRAVRRLPSTLETIFEEGCDNSVMAAISTRKFKRIISFGDSTNKGKIKKRHMKARKLGNRFTNRRKIPMDEFLSKIEDLESDLDEA